MNPMFRRDFLALLGFSAASAAFARPSQIASTKLTDNLTLLTGAGGNIVVLDGPDGLLLVNGSLPEMAADLKSFLGRDVKVLFNTDWHLDHTGSNETLKKAGAK